MPSAQVNTLNCLILQSKTGLRLIPNHMQIYFINSKRRFFLYFRSHAQMLQAMRVLTQHSVRFYRRQSLLTDRQELEQQVFHCGYRYKKVDLRRNLLPGTPYNQPRLHFDRFDRGRNRQEIHSFEPESKREAIEMRVPEMREFREFREMQMEKEKEPEREEEPIMIGGHKFKYPEAARVIMNKELLKKVLTSLTLNPPA